MSKKILSILLTLAMVLAIAPMFVFAEDDTLDYLTYEIVDDEVIIVYGNESIIGDVVIPDKIDGYPVTIINDDAFSSCKSLTGITISDSVTTIGVRAFWGCSNLENVTIGDSVTEIGNDAFRDCSGLKSIVIPDSVTVIGDSAFHGCSSLVNVTISSSVTEIGFAAFHYCDSLESIVIPANVASIGYEAFSYCSNLENIDVDENNKYFSSSKDGVLFNKDETKLICYPIGNSRTEYDIPDSVNSIEFGAFYQAANLKKITIPDSVETIGEAAFAGCFRLEEIIIPDSVTSTIGENAFADCISLKNVIIGNGVTGIEQYAFSGCPFLANVIIGENVTFIGEKAFWTNFGNISLECITIPENVERVDAEAFFCYNALKEINIYNSEMIIAEDSFYMVGILDWDKYSSLVMEIYSTVLTEQNQNLEELLAELLSVVYQIPDNELKDAVIYGYTGSTAEAYATENNMLFAELGQKITPDEDENTTVPEISSDDEDIDSGNDFIGILSKLFERIIDFFTKIFSSLINLFA